MYYIEQRCPDASDFIERNLHSEEPLLQIAARVSAYLKNPIKFSSDALGSLVGNVEKPADSLTAAELIKRTQESMDRKLAEWTQEKEKLTQQNNKLAKQLRQNQQNQNNGQQNQDRRQTGNQYRRRRPEDHQPCRYCVAQNRNGLQCFNLKNTETNGQHCYHCSTPNRMEPWPCAPCRDRLQRLRDQRRQDRGQQPPPPRDGSRQQSQQTDGQQHQG